MIPIPFSQLSHHQRSILDLIRRMGPQSRNILARHLDLTNGAVTGITRQLIELGLLREAPEAAEQRMGRPSIPLAIAPRGVHAYGLSFRPGWVDILCLDLTGDIIAREQLAFADAALDRLLPRIAARIAQITNDASLDPARAAGCGVAIAGYRPSRPQEVHVVEALGAWRGADLAAAFAQGLGLSCRIENVANAGALAEHYGGGGQGARSLFFVNLGYGVGSGTIIDGRIMRGKHGNAGEIGLFFPLDQPRPSYADLLETLIAHDRDPALATSEAAMTDSVVVQWVERAARQLDRPLAAAIAWFDPDRIVIGGALPAPVARALAEAVDLAREFADLPRIFPSTAIVASSLGNSGGATGAAQVALREAVLLAESDFL